jgi:DNA-binding transcriptional LysR family regulator
MSGHIDQLKLTHLRLLARLAETGQISRAAADLGIPQPSASRLLVEIGDLTGHPVHQRAGRGVALTEVGQALARRAARVLLELDDAAEEVADIVSGGKGHVRLGAVTAPAIDLVLPALRTFRLTHPAVTFEVSVAPSSQLCQDLRAGRLDFAIGRFASPEDGRTLRMEPLGTEPVLLIVRRGHPLDRDGETPLAELLRYDWVMPGAPSPLADVVRRGLADLGAPPPREHLTTASFLMTLISVQQTNAIAPLAAAVVRAFTQGPNAPYAEVRTALRVDAGPYGILTRIGQAPPPSAARLIRLLLERAAGKS